MDKLLNQSDFVVLAVPLTDETHHMINSTTLAQMKKNAILINVGRGGKFDKLLLNLSIPLSIKIREFGSLDWNLDASLDATISSRD